MKKTKTEKPKPPLSRIIYGVDDGRRCPECGSGMQRDWIYLVFGYTRKSLRGKCLQEKCAKHGLGGV